MPESNLVKFGSPVTLPIAWADLLDIKTFAEYEEKNGTKVEEWSGGREIPTASPLPYKNDNRMMLFFDTTYKLFVALYSGGHNYWMEYTVQLNVLDGPNKGLDIHKDRESEHKIRPLVKIPLTTGVTLEIEAATEPPEPDEPTW